MCHKDPLHPKKVKKYHNMLCQSVKKKNNLQLNLATKENSKFNRDNPKRLINFLIHNAILCTNSSANTILIK